MKYGQTVSSPGVILLLCFMVGFLMDSVHAAELDRPGDLTNREKLIGVRVHEHYVHYAPMPEFDQSTGVIRAPGTGTIKDVMPDRAVISIAITGTGSTLDKASEKSTVAEGKVSAAVIGKLERASSDTFSITYDARSRAAKSIAVKRLRDLEIPSDKLPAVINALLKIEGVQLRSSSFSLSPEAREKLAKVAKEKALVAAKGKATAIASSNKVLLGEQFKVEEVGETTGVIGPAGIDTTVRLGSKEEIIEVGPLQVTPVEVTEKVMVHYKSSPIQSNGSPVE